MTCFGPRCPPSTAPSTGLPNLHATDVRGGSFSAAGHPGIAGFQQHPWTLPTPRQGHPLPHQVLTAKYACDPTECPRGPDGPGGEAWNPRKTEPWRERRAWFSGEGALGPSLGRGSGENIPGCWVNTGHRWSTRVGGAGGTSVHPTQALSTYQGVSYAETFTRKRSFLPLPDPLLTSRFLPPLFPSLLFSAIPDYL